MVENFKILEVDPEKPETNPRRDGSEFTQREYTAGVLLTQLAESLSEAKYIKALERAFSGDRALAILDKFVEVASNNFKLRFFE